MAPTTAVLTILAGAAIALRAGLSPRRGALRLATILAVIGATAALLLLAQRTRGAYWTVEHLGLRIDGTILGVPVGYISPITAFGLLLANLGLMALPADVERRSLWRATLAWSGGALVGVLGFTLLLMHVFGIPLLWGAASIPPALNTTVVLLIVGVSLLVLAGRLAKEPRVSPDGAPRGSRILIVVFVAFAASTIAAGYGYYRQEERQVREEAGRQLQVIAELKGTGVAQWRTERLADATVMLHSTFLSEAFDRFLQTPGDPAVAARIRDWLGAFRPHRQYDRAFLIDAQGTTRLSLTEEPPSSTIVREAAEVFRTGRVSLQDFYLDERDERIHLAILAPILASSGDRRPMGVLALRIAPASYLYPYIEGWPTPSATAEALLVRREGDEVVYLNDLRFEPNAALRHRISLDQTRVLAVQAVQGHAGAAEGLDYRGAPVLGSLYRIPDSPWYLIARIDVAELRGQLWARVWQVAAFTILLLAGGGTILDLVRRSHRARFYRKRDELTSALRESEGRLRMALAAADQGLYDLNVETGDAVVSPEYVTMIGYDPATFRETNAAWIARLHPDDRDEVSAAYRDYIAGRRDDYRVEFRQLTKSGEWKWILSLGKVVTQAADGRPLRMLGTHTDITVRKTAEIRSQRLAQLYAALSQCSQAIVRSIDEAGLFTQICRDTVVFGGLKMAWIGLVDEAARRIRPVASHGDGAQHLEGVHLSLDADGPLGRSLAASAIRDDQPVWCQDYLHDPRTADWHEQGERAGWAAAAALPLRRQGRPVGSFTLCSSLVGAFDEEMRALMIEMAEDISFALDNFARETARRQAEQALRESEERFRTLFTDSRVPMLLIEPDDGRIVDANCVACAYYGWDLPVLRQMKLTDINISKPESAPEVMAQAREMRDTPFGFRHRLANGETRDVEVFTGSVTVNDQPLLLSTIIDITARTQAEATMADQLAELRRWYQATLGREGRVLEMKREVNELLARLGESPRYPSAQKGAAVATTPVRS